METTLVVSLKRYHSPERSLSSRQFVDRDDAHERFTKADGEVIDPALRCHRATQDMLVEIVERLTIDGVGRRLLSRDDSDVLQDATVSR